MIKAKHVSFWTSNLKGHGFHGEKATIYYLTSEYYALFVLSAKVYFLEIDSVHQTLWPFKYKMLQTLNSNFLDWEDILKTVLLKIFIWYKRCIIKLLQLEIKMFDWKIKPSQFCDQFRQINGVDN